MPRHALFGLLIASLSAATIFTPAPSPAADAESKIAIPNIDREKIQSKLFDIRSNVNQSKSAGIKTDTPASGGRLDICAINPSLPPCK